MQTALNAIYQTLFTPRYRYTDRYDQARARVTLVFSLFVIAATLLLIISLFLFASRNTDTASYLISFVVGLAAGLLVFALVNSGHLRVAILISYILLLVGAVQAASPSSGFVLMLLLPILYGNLIYRWRGLLLTLAIEIGMLLFTSSQQMARLPAGSTAAESILTQNIVNIALLCAAGVFCGAIVQEIQNGLRLVNRLITQLRANSEIAQSSVQMDSLDGLMKRIVNYLRDRFGFSQVQIFTIDQEHRFAGLVASTSESGQALIQRGYRVAIGAQNIIGQAALLGEAVNRTYEPGDSAAPATEMAEPRQEIRSEVALPLIIGDQIIGILDLQSVLSTPFSQDDMDNLRLMAGHVGVALYNARLLEDQKGALSEHRRLFLEAEMNLREMQRLNQRLTGEAWDEYLKARIIGVVGYTITNNQLRSDASWTPMLEQAVTQRRAVFNNNGDKQIIAVPVELRGKSIGAIELEVDGTGRQTETLEMLQSVAQRLALSIDNARLFEQAQELAQTELQVNAITAKLQGISDMDEIVKATVDELGRALGAQQASIRLGFGEHKPSSNGSNGSKN